MGLDSSDGRALQGERNADRGFEFRWSPEILFRATSQLLKLRFNCGGHIFIPFVLSAVYDSFRSVINIIEPYLSKVRTFPGVVGH